jgi:hypothetical protein
LDPASDTGPVNSDGVTNLTTVTVKGLAPASGATIKLYRNGVEVASVVSSTNTYFTVQGTFSAILNLTSGPHTITATQTIGGVTTALGDPLELLIDLENPFLPNYAQLSTVGGVEFVNDAGQSVSNNPNPVLTIKLPEGVKLGDEILLINTANNATIIRQSVSLRELASASIQLDVAPSARLLDGVYSD